MNSTQSYEEKYETLSQRSADLDEFGLEHGDDHYRRPTMYAMPSIDFAEDGVVDSWVDRYGANKADFTYVATVPETISVGNESQGPQRVGFYIPVLNEQIQRTSENAQVAMALLARTFRKVVELPWSTLELLDWALQWSVMPVILEDPTSEIWAEDLFTPCSTKCLISCSIDDFTDCSGSEICDDELDDDEEWSCSDSEEEIDGFNFVDDGDVDFWGDRWLWHEDDVVVVQSYSDFGDLDGVETTNYIMEKLVDYAMPSMIFNVEA
ncbi:Hypothetical protein PHPALM_16617, partial [Phytophthora palmivora]